MDSHFAIYNTVLLGSENKILYREIINIAFACISFHLEMVQYIAKNCTSMKLHHDLFSKVIISIQFCKFANIGSLKVN